MPACRSLERLSRRKWRPTSSHKRRLRYSRKKSASKEPRPPLAAPKHERLLFGKHPPQFCGSLVVSTHCPLQDVVGTEHVLTPLTARGAVL